MSPAVRELQCCLCGGVWARQHLSYVRTSGSNTGSDIRSFELKFRISVILRMATLFPYTTLILLPVEGSGKANSNKKKFCNLPNCIPKQLISHVKFISAGIYRI